MRYLYERADFVELIEAAARHHGIANPAIVEKDYFVTEALRLIARSFGAQVIFKGGTSLSKGWKIIDRFSEDIDLYINPGDRGAKARNTLLKELAACVESHPMLSIDEGRTQRINGLARATTYNYHTTGKWPTVSPTVLLEAGIQSGTFPTENREMYSLLAEFLIGEGVQLETGELDPVLLPLLHFRRTFLEKLFALHHKVEQGLIKEGTPIGGYARHYYDASQLLARPEVQQMLGTTELAEIARDYRCLTKLYFPKQLLPTRMNMHDSKALFPDSDLKATLSREYVAQCEVLCYGDFPLFDEVLTQFKSIQDKLRVDLDEE